MRGETTWVKAVPPLLLMLLVCAWCVLVCGGCRLGVVRVEMLSVQL